MRNAAEGLDLADSITTDGHKWMNVPYDTGLFFCRKETSMYEVFGPSKATGPAAYLKPGEGSITSPLFLGIENSRRFRALPLFCAMMALGRQGYSDLVDRNILFARAVADWMMKGEGGKWYLVLNVVDQTVPLNVVLFRTRKVEEDFRKKLIRRRMVYISETVSTDGAQAYRLAVSNWMTSMEQDLPVVLEELRAVMTGWE